MTPLAEVEKRMYGKHIGGLAERLRSGLQIREEICDSDQQNNGPEQDSKTVKNVQTCHEQTKKASNLRRGQFSLNDLAPTRIDGVYRKVRGKGHGRYYYLRSGVLYCIPGKVGSDAFNQALIALAPSLAAALLKAEGALREYDTRLRHCAKNVVDEYPLWSADLLKMADQARAAASEISSITGGGE